jgi:uncharacterized protein YbjQ (UPF0145 family)
MMPNCLWCGTGVPENAKKCPRCGHSTVSEAEEALPSMLDFLIVTSPMIPGYRIKKTLGIASGLTARTRGIGGKFLAGFQSLAGGEVSAFTIEIEKARIQSLNRMITMAQKMGANAIISLDIETSDVLQVLVLVSATGTAVVAEPE